ncbi:MAG TPA: glycosyltransferase family 4 protein [Terriglobales bacterium]|nr:glycosyltransferase family 4 protein [Terriglobales bacterium]
MLVESAEADASRPGAPGQTVEPWLIVCGGFHQLGGMDRANLALAKYLRSTGHPVTLVGHDFDAESSKQFFNPVSVPRLRWTPLGERLLSAIGNRRARDLRRSCPTARVVVNGGNCTFGDINWLHYVHHAWNPDPRELPMAIQAKHSLLQGMYLHREKRALEAAGLIIANSNSTAQHILRLGIDASKIRVIYLGCSPELRPPVPEERLAARRWLQIAEDEQVVAFVGALGWDDRKGLSTLWRAMNELWQQQQFKTVLVIAGGGAKLRWWRQQIQSSKFRKQVRILGFTDRVNDILAAADLLASPCRYEPYGLNVQEAICRGVPSVVSACAGIAELYPAELSPLLLRDPNDAIALANSLSQCLTEMNLWKEGTRSFANSLQKRTWAEMSREFVTAASRK